MSKFISLLLLGAAAYALSGAIGLLLAIPPGYATAIWPPSGIAVFLVLKYGPRAGLSVLLGSFLVNIYITYPHFADFDGKGLLTCAVIGLGAALQALASRSLTKRFVPNFPSFQSEFDLVKFLILVGPVSCLINATISSATLAVAGSIPTDVATINMVTWYFGDTIGVLFITPLLLLYGTDSISESKRDRVVFTLPIVISFLLAIAVYVAFSKSERSRAENQLETLADKISASLNDSFGRASVALNATEGFFSASDHVSKDEFKMFSERVLNPDVGVRALSWNPIVMADNQDHFLNEARTHIDASYTIRRNSSESKADSKDDFFMSPVLYIEPIEANRGVVGFDIASLADRRVAIEAAIKSKGQAATAPIRLIQSNDELGSLVLTPVQKNKTVMGLAVAVISYPVLIHELTASFAAQLSDKRLEIWDSHAETLIFSSGSATASKFIQASREVHFFDRLYSVKVIEPISARLGEKGFLSYLVLAFGLLFSILISAFIMTFSVRKKLLERSVAVATEQVRIERSKSEEAARLSSLGAMAGGIAHEINNPLAVIDGQSFKLEKLLSKRGHDDQDVFDSLARIRKTVIRISQIIDGLRRLAREGSNDNFESVAANLIVTETMLLCDENFKHSGVRVLVSIPEGLSIRCRRVQFSQVILNLLTNAFHAIKDTDDRWISIDIAESKQNVSLRITDSGSGISEQVRARMFEPFFTTKDVGQGTGLGLSTSRAIIESHGGILRYEDYNGHTSFVIDLPK